LTGEDAAKRARQMLRIQTFKDESEQMARSAEASARYEGDYAKIMSNEQRKGEDATTKN
jgi:hypothetical protein